MMRLSRRFWILVTFAFVAATVMFLSPQLDHLSDRIAEWRYSVMTAPQTRFDHLLAVVKIASTSKGDQVDNAKLAAEELLKKPSLFEKDFAYPNALYYSHIVLGRISVRQGQLSDAERISSARARYLWRMRAHLMFSSRKSSCDIDGATRLFTI